MYVRMCVCMPESNRAPSKPKSETSRESVLQVLGSLIFFIQHRTINIRPHTISSFNVWVLVQVICKVDTIHEEVVTFLTW
jgi:hypothetical protein